MNAVTQILRRQRLLSGMPGVFSRGLGRRSLGVAQARELARFKNPPKRGRPSFAALADRGQLKFTFHL